MKSPILVALLTLSVGAYAFQDAKPQEMQPAQPTEQHKWLQQLVGDWTGVAECTMGPGAEPVKMECTEHVRSLGGLWVLAEGSMTMQGTPMSSVMTLGYDPRQQKFVGSWVDTMMPHMWSYKGTLDDAKKSLTLEAEGPDMADPTKSARYRDVIELKGKDKKSMTSSMLGADGKWTTVATAEYTRKGAGGAK
jgi:hypothetical protein